MGQPLDGVVVDWTYFWVAGASCVFFLIFFIYASPWLSAILHPNYTSFTRQQQIDWDSRVTSTLHSIIVSSTCVYNVFFNDEVVQEPVLWDAPGIRVNISIVNGYLVADALMMLIYFRYIGDVSYFLHHAVSMFAYGFGAAYGVFAYFANFRLLAEVSTPFVNQRWFFTKMDYPKTGTLFIANGLVMWLSFFVCRMVLMPHYWLQVYYNINTPAWNNVGLIQWCHLVPCVLLDILNFYWFEKMTRGAIKVLALCFPSKTEKSAQEKNFSANATVNNNMVRDYVSRDQHISKKHID